MKRTGYIAQFEIKACAVYYPRTTTAEPVLQSPNATTTEARVP